VTNLLEESDQKVDEERVEKPVNISCYGEKTQEEFRKLQSIINELQVTIIQSPDSLAT
jgi:hypothetical protein